MTNLIALSRQLIKQRKYDLIELSDDTDRTEVVIKADIWGSHVTPVGREIVERSFHHTPDIGMGDVSQKYMLYLQFDSSYTPHPGQWVRTNGRRWNIRLINEWPADDPKYYEIMLEK